MNKLILLIACMLVSVCAFAAQPQLAPKFLSLSDMEKVIVPVQPTQNEVAELNAPSSDADCGCNKITIKPDDVTITLCIQEGKNIKCAEVVFESAFTVDIVIVVNSK